MLLPALGLPLGLGRASKAPLASCLAHGLVNLLLAGSLPLLLLLLPLPLLAPPSPSQQLNHLLVARLPKVIEPAWQLWPQSGAGNACLPKTSLPMN
jgi:hypothetical protein